MSGPERHAVVVVGGGPVGHALCVELGRRDVDCVLVERRRQPQRIPKGQNLTQRTMEHFAVWGCAEELRSRRIMPEGYPIGGIVCYGDLTGEYWHAPVGREVVGAYYSQRNERLPQYETEAVLRRRIRSLPSVTALYGWAATAMTQDDDGAVVHVVSEPGGEERELQADYVVGCDGAHSIVRTQAGIGVSGPPLAKRMLLAVLRSRELHDGLARFPERTTYRVMHPDSEGYWRFFGRIDVGEGWFFHAPVPDDADLATFDVMGLLRASAGFAFGAELDHVGFWDLRVEVAGRYRQGRALLAGDACHSHPPYGGYGLNTGLEDAVNLGWKLAAVLAGWGGETLLDSYSDERRPVFVETGADVIAAGIERDREFLERYRPERDRAEFEAAWAEEMAVADTGPRWYEPHYEGSPVVSGPPGGRSGVHGQHSFIARPGHHLAPRRLADGSDAFDLLGTGFTLLALDADERSVASIDEAFRRRRVPLSVVRGGAGDEGGDYGSRLVLVRPDQHVAWVGDAGPQAPDDLVTLLAGTVPASVGIVAEGQP